MLSLLIPTDSFPTNSEQEPARGYGTKEPSEADPTPPSCLVSILLPSCPSSFQGNYYFQDTLLFIFLFGINPSKQQLFEVPLIFIQTLINTINIFLAYYKQHFLV